MNRTTLIALATFVVLLGVVLSVRYWPKTSEDKTFAIEGWKTTAEAKAPASGERATNGSPDAGEAPNPAAEDKAEKPAPTKPEVKFAPIDRVEIVRGGQTIVLEQKGADHESWMITAPIEAQAEWFRVRPILEMFADHVESMLSKQVKPDDLPRFKLDEDNRIGLKLSKGGTVFADIIIGGIEKPDRAATPAGPAKPDTWLLVPGDETTAYRIPSVDLRTPVDRDLTELRSKQIFPKRKQTVSRIVIENPDDQDHPRLVLVHMDAAKDDTAEGDAKKADAGWRFETPKGYRPGGVPTFLAAVLGLRATAFLALDDEAGKAALAKNAARITLETEGGSIVLHVSPVVGDKGYVRVEGRDELLQVNRYAVKNIRKTLADLRDKKIFTLSEDAVTGLRLRNEHGSLAIRRDAGAWRTDGPKGLTLDKKAVERFLHDIVGMAVTNFVAKAPDDAHTGLDKPSRELTIVTAEGSLTLRVGAEEGGKVWAQIEGRDELLRLSSFMAKRLDKKLDDLRDRALFSFNRDEVVGLEIHNPDEPTPIVLSLERATVDTETGETGEAKLLWRATEPKGTGALDQTAIGAIVSTLTKLSAKKVVTDKKAAEAGLGAEAYHIVVRQKDGTTHTLWLSDLEDGGDVYARSDGKWAGKVLTIAEWQSKTMRKSLADLTSSAQPTQAAHPAQPAHPVTVSP